MNLEEIIKTSHVIVHDGRYAYMKVSEAPESPVFMISRDNDEITVVAKEEQLNALDVLDANKWWKLLEIKVSAPFAAKGFLAAIAQTVADHDLIVLIISTFSKDYILVKEETSDKAIQALQDRGFIIE